MAAGNTVGLCVFSEIVVPFDRNLQTRLASISAHSLCLFVNGACRVFLLGGIFWKSLTLSQNLKSENRWKVGLNPEAFGPSLIACSTRFTPWLLPYLFQSGLSLSGRHSGWMKRARIGRSMQVFQKYGLANSCLFLFPHIPTFFGFQPK